MAAWNSPRRSDPDCLEHYHPGAPATQSSLNGSRSGWGERKVGQGTPGSPSFESHSSTGSATALSIRQPQVTSAVPPRCPQPGTCSLWHHPRLHPCHRSVCPHDPLSPWPLTSLASPLSTALFSPAPATLARHTPQPGCSLLTLHAAHTRVATPPRPSCLSSSLPRLL